MSRLKPKFYNILEFNLLENSKFKLCMGVVGYLFLEREGKFKTSWIPSRFLVAMSTHCGQDIIGYLEGHQYIIFREPKLTDDEKWEKEVGIKRMIFDENFKRRANVYFLTNKLRTLRKVILKDEKLTLFIDKHLHYISGDNFNHYEYSYKHITISDVPRNEYSGLTQQEKDIIPEWGQPDVKEYQIDKFGFDNNRWAGTHTNIFYKYLNLIRYTNLADPIELGIKNSELILLADQLLKTVGENDFTNYFKKRRMKNALWRWKTDYDLYDTFFEQRLKTALFGYVTVDEFVEKFPKCWTLLKMIKRGGQNKTQRFYGFTSNMKMPIHKNDIRLKIDDDRAYRYASSYYKIVPLVIWMRQTEIMRKVWRRLKECDIIFIPLQDSVVVSGIVKMQTMYIIYKILKKEIDTRLHSEIKQNNNFRFGIMEKPF